MNAVGLLISAAGTLSRVVAAVLHNASSVAMVANASRLLRHQLGDDPADGRRRTAS